MAVTAKELAKELQLSEAAISMALNNKSGVSTATRKKVIDYAKERGYDFSRIQEANHAPLPFYGTIYFIIFRRHGAIVTDSPFFSQLSQGIDYGCKKARYYLNVFYLYENSNIKKELDEIIQMGCKGIILLGTEMKREDFWHFEKLNVPVVLLDAYFETVNADCVLINNVQGAYLAANHLISRCKCQPGYLKSSYPINNFLERSDGFYKAVRANGMSTSKSIVHYLAPYMEGSYADMLELLENKEETAACYFADNDLIAAGAMKAFKEKGYRIPEDVAFIGFDNMPLSTYIDPTLTTIHVPKQYMGELAAKRMAELLQNPNSLAIKIEITTDLVIRGSA
ncbi:MAG: LacI family DNA-binding transcriptional regulator [Lachnospiraceae bacterium]